MPNSALLRNELALLFRRRRTWAMFLALGAVPILIAVVLVVQSVAESRILIESGWVLVVALALKTKQYPVMDATRQLPLSPELAVETGR